MAFDFDIATKGMVNAINMYANAQAQQSQILNSLLMDEVKRKRQEEDWQKRQEYMSPMDRAFARRYFKENPSAVGDFQGIPGIGMEATQAKAQMVKEGTGGQAKTSQGVNVPSTYTPPASPAFGTVKMGAGGFAPMSPQEQVVDGIRRKIERGDQLTRQEKGLAGITAQEEFENDIEQVGTKKMSWKALKARYPQKISDIQEIQRGGMTALTKAVLDQIEDKIDRVVPKKKAFGVFGSDESYIEAVKRVFDSVIVDLKKDEAKYREMGVDVDALFEFFDIPKAKRIINGK